MASRIPRWYTRSVASGNAVIGGIDSVFALRYLSVLGNSIGIAAMFALGWRLSQSRSCALLAALMWALHPI